jgi:hypothetical protein
MDSSLWHLHRFTYMLWLDSPPPSFSLIPPLHLPKTTSTGFLVLFPYKYIKFPTLSTFFPLPLVSTQDLFYIPILHFLSIYSLFKGVLLWYFTMNILYFNQIPPLLLSLSLSSPHYSIILWLSVCFVVPCSYTNLHCILALLHEKDELDCLVEASFLLKIIQNNLV